MSTHYETVQIVETSDGIEINHIGDLRHVVIPEAEWQTIVQDWYQHYNKREQGVTEPRVLWQCKFRRFTFRIVAGGKFSIKIRRGRDLE